MVTEAGEIFPLGSEHSEELPVFMCDHVYDFSDAWIQTVLWI